MTDNRTSRIRRTMALAVLSAAYFMLFAPTHLRADAECDEICDTNSDCNQTCAPQGTCGNYGVCAYDYNCGDICNSSAACNGACIGDSGWTTCGEYGTCTSNCDPDYEYKVGTLVSTGGAEDDSTEDITNNTCTYKAYGEWTMHDVNDCKDSADWTACGVWETDPGSPTDNCCNEYSCFGSYCP